jgi:hypothetical protein
LICYGLKRPKAKALGYLEATAKAKEATAKAKEATAKAKEATAKSKRGNRKSKRGNRLGCLLLFGQGDYQA